MKAKFPKKSPEELIKKSQSPDWVDRMDAARDTRAGEDILSVLVDDPVAQVRAMVARVGYGLQKLVNDVDKFVKVEVAKRGFGLDKLINDPSREVRTAVVEYQNKHPDKCIRNGNPIYKAIDRAKNEIKSAVAKHVEHKKDCSERS